ncbi:MAG TPA: cupin domain-containing protein [Candidatus Dormibacteraeota bacterium]|jgi:quercetin dioxygenase-like cupin family protein|nr:cupin domain-containing protein [Candidatus Dormibacteraeota bacterium]
METTGVKVLAKGQGKQGWLGGLGARFMIPGSDTAGRFSLVEHSLKPRALAAPLHRHSREDEYSYVLDGRVGALLGDKVVFGEPGDLIYKPRGQWHTYWNAGDVDASLLEIISPAGFEKYFEELIHLYPTGRPQPEAIAPIAKRYGLEINPSTIAALCAEHGLTFG